MFQPQAAPEYAGFWIRVLASFIDALISCVVFFPLGIVIGILVVASGSDPNSSDVLLLRLATQGLSIVVGWLYSAICESSSWQGTVGKKVVGLRVTDLDGRRISFGRATGRHFGKILSTLILFIGFIMVALTEKKQGLHDLLAGTLVVKGAAVTNYPEPPPPPDFGYTGGTFNGR
jgi:uncharacterized RDD family membrane protein YckC